MSAKTKKHSLPKLATKPNENVYRLKNADKDKTTITTSLERNSTLRLSRVVRNSVNKTYTYYMQNLNRLINENKSLEAENNALKEENASLKERISRIDENAIKRVAAQKDEMIECLKGKYLF